MFGTNIPTINKEFKKKIKEKPSKNLIFILESKLIEYGIDRVKYHGGDLEGTSIVRMFQNSNEIFNQIKVDISKMVNEEDQFNEVNDVTKRLSLIHISEPTRR